MTYIERDCGLIGDYDWQDKIAADWLTVDNFTDTVYTPHSPKLIFTDGNEVVIDTSSITPAIVSERGGIKSYLWVTDDVQLWYAEYTTANEFTKPILFPKSYSGQIALASRCYYVKASPVSATSYAPLTALQFKQGDFTKLTADENTIEIDASRPTRTDGKNIIRAINNISADSRGALAVGTDQCLRFEPHRTLPNTLTVADDCTPCCTCDNYILLARQQQQLAQHLTLKIKNLNSLKQKVIEAYEKYNEIIAEKRSKLSEVFIECAQKDATVWLNIYNPEAVDVKTPLTITLGIKLTDVNGNPLQGSDTKLYVMGANCPGEYVFGTDGISFVLNSIRAGTAEAAAFLVKIYSTQNSVTATVSLRITYVDKNGETTMYAPDVFATGTFTRERDILPQGDITTTPVNPSSPKFPVQYECPTAVTVSNLFVLLRDSPVNTLTISYSHKVELPEGKLVALALRRYIYAINLVKNEEQSSAFDTDDVLIAEGSYSNVQLSEHLLTSEIQINEDGEPFYAGIPLERNITETIPINKLLDRLVSPIVRVEIKSDAAIQTPDGKMMYCSSAATKTSPIAMI